ncbi:MAG: hypothetical protein WCK73_11480 [Deltaproteobacteria bacterium]
MSDPERPEPPIIRSALPWGIRARDLTLTLFTWAAALLLLRDFLDVVRDYLTPPRFQLTVTNPTWDAILDIYLRHQWVISAVVVWVLAWGLVFSLRQRTIRAHRAPIEPVSPAEVSRISGVPEGKLLLLGAGRIIDVRSGPGGAIVEATVRPVEVVH